MKRLLVYRNSEEFVIERVNQFNHSFKRFFISRQGLLEGLQSYFPVLQEYEVSISDELGGISLLEEARR